MYRILVCVKAVPSAGDVQLDAEYRLRRDTAPLQWNIADAAALETALRLAQELPACGGDAAGEVTVLCMGPEKLQTALRELLDRGAHQAVLLCGRALSGSDTRATAAALAAAVRLLGPFDLILCGRRAIDGETGQVPGELAAALGLPCVTQAERIVWAQREPAEAVLNGPGQAAGGPGRAAGEPKQAEQTPGPQLLLTRRLDAGTDRLLASGPLVASLCEYSCPLRLPSIAAMRRARSQPVRLIDAAELGLAPGECGLAGSPTRVVRMESRFAARRRGPRETDLAKAAAELWRMLHAAQSAAPGPSRGTAQIDPLYTTTLPGPLHAAAPAEPLHTAAPAEPLPGGGNGPLPAENPLPVLVLCPYRLDAGLVQTACRLAGRPARVLCPQKDAALALAAGAGLVHTLAASPPADEAAFAGWLAQRARAWGSRIILAPSTAEMRSVMPQLAWRLGAGLTADCTGLAMDGERLVQTRPAFGNSLMAVIRCESEVQMATVRPGTFRFEPAAAFAAPGGGAVIPESLPGLPQRVVSLGAVPFAGGRPLSGARIILAGGLGAGSSAGFELLWQLAERVGGGVGASRAAVDAGFAPYRCQVGMTGAAVCPGLYVAFGISGAVQHLAGILGAEKIVAVNHDPKAPIFDYADYGVVGDCNEFLTLLLKQQGGSQP